MIGRDSTVLIKDLCVKGRVAEITSEGICTIILSDSNCCYIRLINDLEKI